MMRPMLVVLLVLALVLGACDGSGPSSSGTPPVGAGSAATAGAGDQDWQEAARAGLERGAAFLRAESRDGKWSFVPDKGPDLGISALVARALLKVPGEGHREAVRPTLEWLVAAQKEDGSIFDQQLATYVTACAVLALRAAGDPVYQPVVTKAADFLRIVQLDEGEGLAESSEDYGGVGYGGSGVTNLSTTQWAVEAASEAGLPKDDDFYRKAILFLTRSQNRSESNDRSHVLPDGTRVEAGNDGGGIYRPSESKAGLQVLPDGRRIFRSYGSMTYALLKSYLLCDLDPRDGRVQAALDWIGKNWVLDYNPGMEHREEADARYEGLYYYYLTLARTLAAAEQHGIPLGESALGRWRQELAGMLVSRQASDGSWVNQRDRWWEGSSVLVTAYAMLTLEECLGVR